MTNAAQKRSIMRQEKTQIERRVMNHAPWHIETLFSSRAAKEVHLVIPGVCGSISEPLRCVKWRRVLLVRVRVTFIQEVLVLRPLVEEESYVHDALICNTRALVITLKWLKHTRIRY